MDGSQDRRSYAVVLTSYQWQNSHRLLDWALRRAVSSLPAAHSPSPQATLVHQHIYDFAIIQYQSTTWQIRISQIKQIAQP